MVAPGESGGLQPFMEWFLQKGIVRGVRAGRDSRGAAMLGVVAGGGVGGGAGDGGGGGRGGRGDGRAFRLSTSQPSLSGFVTEFTRRIHLQKCSRQAERWTRIVCPCAAVETLPCGKEWEQCGGTTITGPFTGASCCSPGLACKAGTDA